MKMRKLCPNLDREDGLETVLEVPVPEEMFTKMGSNAAGRWRNMSALMKAHAVVTAVAADIRTPASSSSMSNVNMHLQSKSDNEFVALLKIVGSPLIPFHVPLEFCLSRPINDTSIVRFLSFNLFCVCVFFLYVSLYRPVILACLDNFVDFSRIFCLTFV